MHTIIKCTNPNKYELKKHCKPNVMEQQLVTPLNTEQTHHRTTSVTNALQLFTFKHTKGLRGRLQGTSHWSIWNNYIIIHSFYIAPEQTHCAHWHVILNEWLYPFVARTINIHGSGVLVALFGCCTAGATCNAAVSAQVLCTPFIHAPGNSVTSLKAI